MGISLDIAVLYDISPVERDEHRDPGNVRAASDASLLTWAPTGDFAAFEELVKRYRNDVFRVAYHFVRDREEAWDLSQEVFLKAYRGLRRFRGDANFKTWLLRITTNQCKDHFKKRRLPTVAFDETVRIEDARSPVAEPSEALAARELGDAIQAALAELPHKHRTTFVLREFEGLSYEEMAQAMGCNLGTVMSRLHHARRKLRDRLVRMGIVEDLSHE